MQIVKCRIKVYEQIPETVKILCNSEILDIKGYIQLKFFTKHMINQTRKCLFFNRVIQEVSNLMVEEGFFYEKLQKEQKSWTFLIFFKLQKKVTTLRKKFN